MKKVKTLLAVGILMATTTACQKDCEETAANTLILCNKIYQPVCGCNNKTYGNSCEAEAVGITNYTQGTCK